MTKILILGHNGMLGNVNYKYFSEHYDVETLSKLSWDTTEFKRAVLDSDAEFIINCIGAINQKNPSKEAYESLNVRLPMFLEYSGKKVIHPSTDCEFSGDLEYPQTYEKTHVRDADDIYGQSKAKISKRIEDGFNNTKIIRTGINGHEVNSHYSLLDWFLSNDDNKELNGFANYWWNGVTTLQWCKVAERILLNWDKSPVLTQVGSEGMHKCDLLKTMAKVYSKPNVINEFFMETPLNKMLESDYELPTIEEQLLELKE